MTDENLRPGLLALGNDECPHNEVFLGGQCIACGKDERCVHRSPHEWGHAVVDAGDFLEARLGRAPGRCMAVSPKALLALAKWLQYAGEMLVEAAEIAAECGTEWSPGVLRHAIDIALALDEDECC